MATDLEAAEELLREWREAEARTAEIKRRFANVLAGGGVPAPVSPAVAPPPPKTISRPSDDLAPRGARRGMEILRALQMIGHAAGAVEIAKLVPPGEGQSREQHLKAIRSLLSYMSRHNGLVEMSEGPGFWIPTAAGYTRLAGESAAAKESERPRFEPRQDAPESPSLWKRIVDDCRAHPSPDQGFFVSDTAQRLLPGLDVTRARTQVYTAVKRRSRQSDRPVPHPAFDWLGKGRFRLLAETAETDEKEPAA